MTEEILFRTEKRQHRAEIATIFESMAEQLESGTVRLDGPDHTRTVAVPAEATLRLELECHTGPDADEERYELEYIVSWPLDR